MILYFLRYQIQQQQEVTQRNYSNIALCNSYTRSNFYSNRVINDWNSLPQFIVDSPSVDKFKILLDSHYRNNCLFDYAQVA